MVKENKKLVKENKKLVKEKKVKKSKCVSTNTLSEIINSKKNKVRFHQDILSSSPKFSTSDMDTNMSLNNTEDTILHRSTSVSITQSKEQKPLALNSMSASFSTTNTASHSTMPLPCKSSSTIFPTIPLSQGSNIELKASNLEKVFKADENANVKCCAEPEPDETSESGDIHTVSEDSNKMMEDVDDSIVDETLEHLTPEERFVIEQIAKLLKRPFEK